jgi:hypothetical protein
VVFMVARGAAAVFEAVRERNRFAAYALVGVIVLAPLWESAEVLRRPMRHEQLAPVLEQAQSEYRPGDRVYVYYGAGPAFTFYTRERPFPAEAVTVGASHRDDPQAVCAELADLRGRVWVIISHRHHDEESVIRATLDTRGRCERDIKRPGAAAYLYRLADDRP